MRNTIEMMVAYAATTNNKGPRAAPWDGVGGVVVVVVGVMVVVVVVDEIKPHSMETKLMRGLKYSSSSSSR